MTRNRLPAWVKDPSSFDPEADKLDVALVDRGVTLVTALSHYFRPSFHGIHNIPARGPALLVGNHGLFGFDGFFILTEVYRRTGRLPRGLADDVFFVHPRTHALLDRLGVVHGTPENAVRFLRAGHLVNVYPGGARDALKSPESLYKLQWARSKGFIRVAMQAQAPIILHIGIGTDDTFRTLGKLDFTGRVMGNDKYQVPVLLGWGPLPRPVKFTYYVSEPIVLDGSPEESEDPALVDANHRRVWDLGQEMLDLGLRRRNSIWTG